VLERYEDFRRLHTRAVRTEAAAQWHALRVVLKRFRYAVESLLPERSVVWDEGLERVQSVLGEIHDLDNLSARMTRESDGIDRASAGALRRAITTKRRACINQYRQYMRGDDSLLREWRAGLPRGEAIASATAARLRTTAHAMDPHPRRTAARTRLALALFDGLAASGAERRFGVDRVRMILRAAAELHAIRVGGGHAARHKAACEYLRGVPAPPGWTPLEWEILAEVVRYHRGAEPTARHKPFAQLSLQAQDCVCGLAGVVRLSRGLRRCGVTVADGIRVQGTTAYVRLVVAGLQDTEENAARLAASKHLLERYLRRPILIESVSAATSFRTPRLAYSSHRFRAGMTVGLGRPA
jgi:hypothetical protein